MTVTNDVAAPPPSPAFELKYVLPAWRAAAVAAWLDGRCPADPLYPVGHVRTLYLDTPDRRFLAEKVDGDFLKTKIRLRWYAPALGAPAAGAVWLEIKQRAGLSRAKTRIRFPALAADVDGIDPGTIDVRPAIDLARQRGLDVDSSLRPTLALSYLRHRWVEPFTGVRVAVDSAIAPTWARGHGRPPESIAHLATAVVEFKGAEPEVPGPLRAVVDFGGRRTSVSKYFSCYARICAAAVLDDGGSV